MGELVRVINGKKRRTRVEAFALGTDNTILVHTCRIIEDIDGVQVDRPGIPETPGGGVNEDETVLEAATRETLEEAGWEIEKPSVLNVPGNWVFDGKGGDGWFADGTWDEEESIAVICQAAKFVGGSEFGSEGDAAHHRMVPITEVIRDLLLVDKTKLSPPNLLALQFRFAVLNYILGHEVSQWNVGVESYAIPRYTQW